MNRPTAHTKAVGKDPTSRKAARRRGSAVVASAALAASAVSALPASASVTGNGVRDGSNIMVMHNIDFVAVGGYGAIGDATNPVTVEVLRDGVVIGSAGGPAIDAEGAPGHEVNHGPEGEARPGDCFDGHTPDIRPGDVIHVTDATGTDEVTVDDIGFTSQPFLARNGDVLVEGVARTFEGAAIPLAQLDSAEFRDGSAFRIFAHEVRLTQRPDEVGGFTLRYPIRANFERNRDNRTPAEIQQTLMTVDGHAMGFGHIEPAPADAQMVEGLGDTPGPAPGCEAAPSAQWAVTGVTPANLNLANQAGGLTVRGVSHDTSSVRVDLTDAAGAVASKEATPAANGNWTAVFETGDLAALDGDITVSGLYSLPGGDITGATMSLVKDLVAPNAPTASLPAGTYRGEQSVDLSGAAGEELRYTLGNGRQAAPTADSGTVYQGPISVTSSQTLKAVAVDEAGNVSAVAQQRYRIADVPSRPRMRRALSGARGGRDTATARWRRPVAINGSRITGYRVTALRLRRNGSVATRRDSRMLSAGSRAFEMRLRAGRYRFQVRAYNGVGQSRLSPRSNIAQSR